MDYKVESLLKSKLGRDVAGLIRDMVMTEYMEKIELETLRDRNMYTPKYRQLYKELGYVTYYINTAFGSHPWDFVSDTKEDIFGDTEMYLIKRNYATDLVKYFCKSNQINEAKYCYKIEWVKIRLTNAERLRRKAIKQKAKKVLSVSSV